MDLFQRMSSAQAVASELDNLVPHLLGRYAFGSFARLSGVASNWFARTTHNTTPRVFSLPFSLKAHLAQPDIS